MCINFFYLFLDKTHVACTHLKYLHHAYKIDNQRSYYKLPNSAYWGWLSLTERVSRLEKLIMHSFVYRCETVYAIVVGPSCSHVYTLCSASEMSPDMRFATSKGSDQPALTRSLIRAFTSRLNILWVFDTDWTSLCASTLEGGCTCSSESTLVKMPLCWKSHAAAQMRPPGGSVFPWFLKIMHWSTQLPEIKYVSPLKIFFLCSPNP